MRACSGLPCGFPLQAAATTPVVRSSATQVATAATGRLRSMVATAHGSCASTQAIAT
ncbi:hypothetical protein [Ornithobacterium rhinotracheale]|uniref:hypothetical protein n=1 Tax=Ornithobacterium rhinotracheale TaxID=28251 RepID=UPI0021590218|nr:hypothetical protein [Ornithobacterium rhinotracheale]UVD86363.1 hypothetical protein NV236_06665 [Ornithobacterium rhinotracheale]